MIVPVIRRHTRRQMERILVSTEINIAEDVAAASHAMLTKVKEEVAFSLVNFVGHYHLSFLESVTVWPFILGKRSHWSYYSIASLFL